MDIYIYLVPIFLCAAFIQGFSGFGSALIAMPLLLLFLDAKTAVPLCMLSGLIITGFLTLRLKHHFDKKKIMPLFIGCIPGIALGIFFLKTANNAIIKDVLGFILIAYSVYNLIIKPRPQNIRTVWAYVAGFAAGTIGAAFSAGGPPVIIYTTLNNWTKDEIKATLTGFFFITGLLVAIAHAVAGLTTPDVLRYFLITVPPVLAGVITGSALYDKITKTVYIKALFILLFIMGVMLVFGPGV